MSAARGRHSSTRLVSGDVLLAGGNAGAYLTSAEKFTTTGSFAAVGSMTTPRYAHGAALMADGRVLVVGGYKEPAPNYVTSGELFDPVTETFTAAGDMSTGRHSPTASLLTNGKVLVAGGYALDETPTTAAELFSGEGDSHKILTLLTNSYLWIGLKNSDDQGTRFDLRTQVFVNGEFVSAGLTRCIVGVTRNPNQALQAIVTFDPFTPVAVSSGDVLSFRVSTRIGTNPNDTKCAGHNNAVGLRLYYDGVQRQSRFVGMLFPDPLADFFLHSAGSTDFLDNLAPVGTSPLFKDSAAVNFAGGNPWKNVGEWSLTMP
jgi:hypothetical protein